MKKTLSIAFASLLMALSLTPAAFAQSSVDGYAPDDGAVQNQIEGNDESPSNETSPQNDSSPATPAQSNDSGSLPFTGLDLALLAGAGAVLLALGLGMRHLTRSPESLT